MKTLFALLFSSAVLAFGQNPVPPDCNSRFSFTAAGLSSPTITNFTATTGNNCVFWFFTYSVSGSASALSIQVQSAPPSSSTPTAAGTFVTFAGSAVVGSITNTNTGGASAFLDNGAVDIPFARAHITSLTASAGTVVYGVLQGWNAGNAGAAALAAMGSGGSGCTSPCTVIQPTASTLNAQVQGPGASGSALSGNPNRIGVSDGTDTRDILGCNSSVIISDSSSGNTQIIALSGSTAVHVCKLSLTTASSVNVQLTQGTGTNCAGSTTNLSGEYQSASAIAEDFATNFSYLIGVAGDALCLNLSSGVLTTGQIWYDQF